MNAPTNQIYIALVGDNYMATFVGPHGDEVRAAFGTDTLPTPYRAAMPVATVLAEIRRCNPGVAVRA